MAITGLLVTGILGAMVWGYWRKQALAPRRDGFSGEVAAAVQATARRDAATAVSTQPKARPGGTAPAAFKPAETVVAGRPGPSAASTGVRLNVNLASAAELEGLPYIGPELAQRIVVAREAQGPFRAWADLERVRGIGPKTVDRLRPHLTLE